MNDNGLTKVNQDCQPGNIVRVHKAVLMVVDAFPEYVVFVDSQLCRCQINYWTLEHLRAVHLPDSYWSDRTKARIVKYWLDSQGIFVD